uniref:Scavenger receptor class B member 1 n=1 Tax=Timema cristinae TaxID=61476 RepID=A0A7R9H2L7_TIMCR|nr:unnamed protein product [Timema cristinae]
MRYLCDMTCVVYSFRKGDIVPVLPRPPPPFTTLKPPPSKVTSVPTTRVACLPDIRVRRLLTASRLRAHHQRRRSDFKDPLTMVDIMAPLLQIVSNNEHFMQGTKKTPIIRCGLLVPIVVLLLACFGTAILATTDMFNSSITQRLVISNTSETFSLWQRPPVHPLLKMFIFNYTNVDNFKDGIDGKLNVQEVGPYIYRWLGRVKFVVGCCSETVEKVNIVFNDDSTLTFQENRTYQFLPEKSAGSEDDLIITPSIPLISADNELRKYHLNYFARFMVSATLRKIEPFRDLRVQDFLWGYDDPVYETAKTLAAFLNPLPYEKFGILVARNGLSEDRVTMHSGVDDMSKLGIISRFNGIQELSHWGTAECNRIDGTDGTLYPVNQVSPNNILHVFNHDLCRRFPLIFEKNVETKEGIPALRFHAPRNVFDNPSTNPDNMCYCNEPSIPCLPAGVFNVSPCAFDYEYGNPEIEIGSVLIIFAKKKS